MINKKMKISGLAFMLLLAGIIFYLLFQEKTNNEKGEEESSTSTDRSSEENDVVAVEDFLIPTKGSRKDYSDAIQKAIDFCAAHKKEKVKLKANKKYTIKSGFTVKEGVKVEFGQNSILIVTGDFQVMNVEKDAVIINGTIQVMDPSFGSEVIYLKGNEQFDATNKTRIENMTIVNESGKHEGIGLSLYAKGPWHNISFVNFENISIVGFKTGIQLKAENPEGGTYSWVNANRFENITLEDCVQCIKIIGSMNIPNECSGNLFTGLQVQLTENTKQLLMVDGSHNQFESIVWDVQRIQNHDPLIIFTSKTEKNQLDTNLSTQYINDNGQNNEY
ncbi:hypothetical protein [Domibacillus aminovorans]|uniref:Pectate lyase superfamily protein domain-containing protein n=1 Tax=Domibacillus aminovorans TaxID=29332 RepID=A0A177L282_9BACI|nr:hypothetical protein [Domibacillus aminovorans]OAH59748.1 hypothetical protein AWH49_03270 [Domibacillus aminovorans]